MARRGERLFRAPLFDQFHEKKLPFEGRSSRAVLPLDMYYDSIRDELHRILNTRYSAIPKSIRAKRESDDPHPFGLQDFSSFDVVNSVDRKKLADAVKAAIQDYEPRIKDVEVVAESFDKYTQSLKITVSGTLHLKPLPERFSFPMYISPNR